MSNLEKLLDETRDRATACLIMHEALKLIEGDHVNRNAQQQIAREALDLVEKIMPTLNR